MVMLLHDFKFCALSSVRLGVILCIIVQLISNGLTLFSFYVTLVGIIIGEQELSELNNDEFNNRMRPVLWIFIGVLSCFIIMESLFVGLLVYGLRKNKPTAMKIHLIYSVIMWVIGVMTGVSTVFVFAAANSILRAVTSVFHGFMLLNLRRLYAEMTKKLQTETTLTSETMNTTVVDVNYDVEYSRRSTSDTQHYRTCNCNRPLALRNETSEHERLTLHVSGNTSSLNSGNTNADQESDEERTSNRDNKQLNFKELNIVYDEEQLQRSQMNAAGACFSEQENGSGSKDKNEIVDEEGVPVIYDENQFNVGTSPILKEKSLNAAGPYPLEYRREPNDIKYKKIIYDEKDVPVIYDQNQLKIGGNPILENKISRQNSNNNSVQSHNIYLPSSSTNIIRRVS